MKIFKWQVRVYYEDTDAGGVVYHARYIAFYERARTEILREKGIEQTILLDNNIAFVVKKINVDYISAARLDNLLTIESEIQSVRKASLIFKQQIVDENNVLISKAEALIACVDISKMKPMALPSSIITEFI